MSTVSRTPDLAGPPPGGDPFRLGWRYVPRTLPDGRTTVDQVPLTVDDVLHPQEGDFRVHSEEHWKDCEYLSTVFKSRVASDPEALVLADHRVAWDDPGVRPHGPDVAVYFGVDERQRPGATFDVDAEGTRPGVIVEIVSPETRDNDVVVKLAEYSRVGVECYVIVDTEYRDGRRIAARLLGYRNTPDGYVELPLNDQGRLWLVALGVGLGIDGVQVACYDASGAKIGDYVEVARAWEAEVQARQAAERRVRQAERARAAAERQAQQEAEARAAAEARIRELEEQLRRQKPPKNGQS